MMDPFAVRDLHLAMTDTGEDVPTQRFVQAVIVAWHSGTHTVDITEEGGSGTIPGVRYSDHFSSFTAGDTVWVLRAPPDRIVIARVA
jgi:hypothetical protein